MKLNSNINFKFKSKSIPGILSGLLVLALLAELWVLYSNLYRPMFREPVVDVSANVVRVNMELYNKSLDYVNSLGKFEPNPQKLPKTNIFR